MSGDDFLAGMDEDDDDGEPEEVIDVEAEADQQSTVHDTSVPAESGGILRPVSDDLDEIAEVYNQYEEIKTKLLDKNDTETINGSPMITKSGWRKIATAFNVSVRIIEKEKEINNGVLTWRVTAEASAPNGKSIQSTGSAASNESNHMGALSSYAEKDKESEDVLHVDGKWRVLKDIRAVNEHNVLATAETRAKNRAISDLVGGGEVSAEEMDPLDAMG